MKRIQVVKKSLISLILRIARSCRCILGKHYDQSKNKAQPWLDTFRAEHNRKHFEEPETVFPVLLRESVLISDNVNVY